MASTGSLRIPVSPISLRYRAGQHVRPKKHVLADKACRVINVSVALAGLVLTAPLMLVIAVLVGVTSRGPIIYRQPRVGIDRRWNPETGPVGHRRSDDRGGKIFTMYKFRTMRVATERGSERWSSRNDPRVTPVGRLLRATRLDELPQFVNVLRGEMNIVGPRPEQPTIFRELSQEVGRYRRRQRVLPGITGLAQIQVGYDTDVNQVKRKVELDLEYIRGRSAASDLKIMAKTLPVMLLGKVWVSEPGKSIEA